MTSYYDLRECKLDVLTETACRAVLVRQLFILGVEPEDVDEVIEAVIWYHRKEIPTGEL